MQIDISHLNVYVYDEPIPNESNIFPFFFFFVISERKLQPNEVPHQLYVQNYSTASSTCLCVRRWLFSIDRETTLPNGEQAAQFIFYQVRSMHAQIIFKI